MKTTRRRFLQFGGAAAGLSLLPARLLGASAPSESVRVGVVGLGGMGRRHLEALLALEGATVGAVCDVDPAKAESARRAVDARRGRDGCLAATDYRALCERSDLDVVVVAVPDYLHARVALHAIGHGKDVFGETPFAHTLEEGQALAAAVARTGAVWQSGNTQRADARFRRAVAAVRGGAVGCVARVEVGLPGGGRGPRRSAAALDGVPDYHWRWVRAWGGGALAEGVGCYGDTALWGAGLAEEPLAVRGSGEYPCDGPYDTATAFEFVCRYRGGLEVVVADGGRLEKGVGVRWIGRDGSWVWVTQGALQASSPRLLEDVLALPLPACEGLHRDFVACVRTRRTTLAPAEPARLAAALAQAGERAMRG